jgi:hypothetical protein
MAPPLGDCRLDIVGPAEGRTGVGDFLARVRVVVRTECSESAVPATDFTVAIASLVNDQARPTELGEQARKAREPEDV